MRALWIILFSTLPIWTQAQSSFYLTGQVKDENNKGLQNVAIRLYSSGTVYATGTDGYFGIVSPQPVDSASFYIRGYDSTVAVLTTSRTASVQLKVDKLLQSRSRHKLISATRNFRSGAATTWLMNESYTTTLENGFVPANRFATTEVCLNYNRASYSNIRRFLLTSDQVPSDAVRIEEMLNYFDWKYEPPENDETFALRSYLTICPWNRAHRLLFLNLSARKVNCENLPPSHLVFLLDVSGSMDLPNRLPLLKSAFRVLVNNLREKDTVSIVAYGGSTRIVLEATSGKEKSRINRAIDSLQAGGSTPGGSGIKLAYRMARRHFIKGGNNRVILATDGDFNIGVTSEAELEKLITQEKESGLYLTCLGVGMGNYKDSKIQALAQKGNGNFAYLDSYAEAAKVLFKEFSQTLYTVADDATMTVKFNPEYVQHYRLVGFDNRISAARDTGAVVAGGEIGSGNSLVIAFEIIPQKMAPPANLADVRIHYQYKNQPGYFSKTIPARTLQPEETDHQQRLATAIVLFGMKLKQSPYVRNIRWDAVINQMKHTIDQQNYAELELYQLARLAKRIYGGKRFLIF